MRLTKSRIQEIVDSIVADLPKVDYLSQYEELVQAEVVKTMPEPIRKIYENPSLRDELRTGEFRYKFMERYRYRNFRVYGFVSEATKERIEKHPGAAKIGKLYNEQVATEEAVREKLLTTLPGFTTVKAAKAAMPELEKYFPVEVKKIKTLPVTTGLITSLMEAGLPFSKT